MYIPTGALMCFGIGGLFYSLYGVLRPDGAKRLRSETTSNINQAKPKAKPPTHLQAALTNQKELTQATS